MTCARLGCNSPETYRPVLKLRATRDGEAATAELRMALCTRHKQEVEAKPELLVTREAWQMFEHEFRALGKLPPKPEHSTMAWRFVGLVS